MREIKFRAWTDKGEMIYNYCQLICNRFFGEDMTNTNYGNVVDIMQFTGLYDCEGKEIYEGDIVRGAVLNASFADCRVFFDDGSFCIEQLSGEKIVAELCDFYKKVKIIGNIHEA